MEAQEVAVRVAMLGGAKFKRDSMEAAASVEGIGAAGKKAGKEMNAGLAGSGLDNFGRKLKSVGGKVSALGRALLPASVGIGAALYYAGKQYSSFNQKMTLLVTQARLAPSQLAGVTKGVLDIAKATGQTPNALADAMYPIESIGQRGKKALDALKASAIGTAVGLDALSNTSDAVTTAIASGIKGTGGPLQAMAIMDQAIGEGKMHLADLTESFKSGLIPMASTFGLSFQQVLATTAALSRVGTPPASAMARMRLTLTSLASPTKQGRGAMATLGFGPLDLAQMMQKGGLLPVLEALKDHGKKFTSVQFDDLIAQIFGKSRGMANISELLKYLPQVEEIFKNLTSTTSKTLMTHFAETKATPAYKLAQLKSNFDASMVQLGKVVTKDLLPVLETLGIDLSRVVGGFSKLPHPLQRILIIGLALVAILGPLLIFLGGLITAVGIISGALTAGAGLFTGAIGLVIGTQGLVALRVGIAATTAELLTLAAPIAAVLGVYEMWKNKKIYHAIEGAGYKVGTFVGDYLAKDLVKLGFKHADDYYKMQRYLGGSSFTHLSPLVRGDITALMNPKMTKSSPFLPSIERDLKGAGITNLENVPGISTALKEAVKEGIKQASITVLVPNGKVLAETVNTANRKQQNRR